MNDLLKHGDCCAPCADPIVVQVPGVKGDDGGDGDGGANGSNAWTTLTLEFEVPAINGSAEAEVGDSTFITPGQIIYLQGAGYFEATGKADNNHVTLKNLGYIGNAPEGTLIISGSQLSPAGRQGPDAITNLTDLLTVKQSVRAATTANITLAGLQTVDGVSLLAGDRVLVKDQTSPAQNGVYIVVDPGFWTRATDADTDAEVMSGMFMWVMEGTAHADSGWVLTTDNPIVLGATGLVFAQFTGATAALTAGNGIVVSGGLIYFAQVAAYTPGEFAVATGAATMGFTNAITVSGSAITFAGTVTLSADPVAALEAATKQYVDAGVAAALAAVTAGNGLVKVGNTLHFAQAAAYTNGAIPFTSAGAFMAFDPDVLNYDIGSRELRFGEQAVGTVPWLVLRSRATSANVGIILFRGRDSTETDVEFGRISLPVISRAAGAEDATMDFSVLGNVGFSLSKTGAAIFTGSVTLPADPTVALEAATKQYVDGLIGGASVTAGRGIDITGGAVNFAQAGAYTTGAIPFASGAATMGFDAANFSYSPTGGLYLAGTVGTGPGLHISESAAAVDNKHWSIIVNAGYMQFLASNDAQTLSTYFLGVLRSGISFTEAYWEVSRMSINGALSVGTATLPIAGARLDIYDTAAENQQLFLRNAGTYHTGLVASDSATPLADANAWGLFGGPGSYLTGTAYAVALLLPTGVPEFQIRTGAANVNAAGTIKFKVDQAGLVSMFAPLTVSVVDAGVGTRTLLATFARTGAATTATERAAGFVFSDANNATLTGGIAGIRLNSNANFAGALAFYVANQGGVSSTFADLTEAMRISNLGNVGIGTVTPGGYRLNVQGASATVFNAVNLQNTDTTNGAETVLAMSVFNGSGGLTIRQSTNATGPAWATGSFDAIIQTSQSGSYLHFAAGASNNPQLSISPAGLVTIPSTVTALNFLTTPVVLTYAATTNIDMDASGVRTLALTGNVTFTTSNKAAGKTTTIKILADASSRNLTFPAWIFIGAAAPTAIAAGKTAILTVTAFGTADTDIVAAYAVQP